MTEHIHGVLTSFLQKLKYKYVFEQQRICVTYPNVVVQNNVSLTDRASWESSLSFSTLWQGRLFGLRNCIHVNRLMSELTHQMYSQQNYLFCDVSRCTAQTPIYCDGSLDLIKCLEILNELEVQAPTSSQWPFDIDMIRFTKFIRFTSFANFTVFEVYIPRCPCFH